MTMPGRMTLLTAAQLGDIHAFMRAQQEQRETRQAEVSPGYAADPQRPPRAQRRAAERAKARAAVAPVRARHEKRRPKT